MKVTLFKALNWQYISRVNSCTYPEDIDERMKVSFGVKCGKMSASTNFAQMFRINFDFTYENKSVIWTFLPLCCTPKQAIHIVCLQWLGLRIEATCNCKRFQSRLFMLCKPAAVTPNPFRYHYGLSHYGLSCSSSSYCSLPASSMILDRFWYCLVCKDQIKPRLYIRCNHYNDWWTLDCTVNRLSYSRALCPIVSPQLTLH